MLVEEDDLHRLGLSQSGRRTGGARQEATIPRLLPLPW